MKQKTFTIKFYQNRKDDGVEIVASSYPFVDRTLICTNWIPCPVFNWLHKIIPENKTIKGKVTIVFETE